MTPTSPSSVRRILVVDDNPELRRMLETVLRGAGYGVSCAGDGEEGWAALCSGSYDALITDHEMPRLTGLGLVRRVRTALRNLPVILISGRVPWGEKEIVHLLTPGLALEKPLSMPVLLAKVSAFLAPRAPTKGRKSGPALDAPVRPPSPGSA